MIVSPRALVFILSLKPMEIMDSEVVVRIHAVYLIALVPYSFEVVFIYEFSQVKSTAYLDWLFILLIT